MQYLLISLLITVGFTTAARFFVFKGSMFDPAIAPGIGPVAAGDLLWFGALGAGFLAIWVDKQRGQKSGRAVVFGLLAIMFVLAILLVPRGA